MPAFDFSTITADQAVAFSANTSTLNFVTDPPPANALPATAVTVLYTGGGASLQVADRTVVFGGGFLGQATSVFADGSRLFVGGAASESVDGTASRDQLLGGDGADTLSGLDGSDSLGGGAGADLLNGGAGDDSIQGGGGNDTLDGGAGFDVLSFQLASSGVTVTLGGAQSGEGSDVVSNFEALEGGGFEDLLNGDAQANLVRGGNGDDTVRGLAGDDSLEGGRGDDSIDGGVGLDTLVYTNATSGVFVNLETGRAISFDTVLGNDVITGVENVTTGELGDAITGDAQANRLSGLGGGDSLNGGGGGDTLEGGEGSDRISGDAGDDRIVGGLGADTLTGGDGADSFEVAAGDSPSGGFVTLIDRITDFATNDILLFRGGATPTEANYKEFFTLGFIDARDQAQDLFTTSGFEYIAVQLGAQVTVFAPRLGTAVTFDGNLDSISASNISNNAPVTPVSTTPSSGADSLQGGSGPDTINAGAGNDTVDGGAGVSYLRGDEGDDRLTGGADFDDINGNMGNDTVATGAGDDYCVGGRDNDSLAGGPGADLVYGNLGSDTCEGGDGNDIVRGGQEADVVSGGLGDDFVSGDKGDDTMTGGAGADIFHTFGDANIDRVTDFNRAQGDRVQLDPGTIFTVSQVLDDTIINMGGGGQMILVGVQMSTLTPGWIFGA